MRYVIALACRKFIGRILLLLLVFVILDKFWVRRYPTFWFSSTWLMNWWVVFVVWLTDKRRLALFPAGTIVRDPHQRESPTIREQDLNLSSGLVEWSCAVATTTTPRRYFICCFNPFLANIVILCPLKTPENQRFCCVLGGIKWEHWKEMGQISGPSFILNFTSWKIIIANIQT